MNKKKKKKKKKKNKHVCEHTLISISQALCEEKKYDKVFQTEILNWNLMHEMIVLNEQKTTV